VPGWKNSLLITSLKQGRIVRLKLNADATAVESQQEYFVTGARYRDITVSPDGKKIYVVTDKSVVTSGPTENKPAKPGLHGALIEFTYSPGAISTQTK
jgi:glucose/arabinose dehydrogenase